MFSPRNDNMRYQNSHYYIRAGINIIGMHQTSLDYLVYKGNVRKSLCLIKWIHLSIISTLSLSYSLSSMIMTKEVVIEQAKTVRVGSGLLSWQTLYIVIVTSPISLGCIPYANGDNATILDTSKITMMMDVSNRRLPKLMISSI